MIRRGKYESEMISSDQLRLMQLQEKQEEFRREREKAELRKQQVRDPLISPHFYIHALICDVFSS